MSAFNRAGRVFRGGEINVTAGGEGVGVQALRPAVCLTVGVDAHAAEILSETRFHEAARGWLKRLAALFVARNLLHGIFHAAASSRCFALHSGLAQSIFLLV